MTSYNNSFILKRNKKTGNYTILEKGKQVRRVTLNIQDVYLPFGREHYNDKLLLNGIIKDSSNYNNNNIITLQRIIDTFTLLKNTNLGKYKYNISDKTFFSFLKEIPKYEETDNKKTKIDSSEIKTDSSETKTDSSETKTNNSDTKMDSIETKTNNSETKTNNSEIKTYNLRLYLKYSAKVTHRKYIGELDYDQLKGKTCNLDVEMGSLWVNESTSQYGINVYVTHITIIK